METRIGILTTYFSGVYLGEIFAELIRLAPERGCRLVTISPGEAWAGYESSLSTALCDGWIVLMEAVAPAQVGRLMGGGRPVCTMGHQSPVDGTGSVRSDNATGVRLGLQNLYDQGHRRFAFLGNLGSSDIRERRDAFLTFLEDHDLPREAARVLDSGSYSRSGGVNALVKLEESGVDYTALLAGNDQNAAGALEELRRRGLSVPHQVAIMGYDNSTLAHEEGYSLTSVDQNLPGLAHAAFDQVLGRIQHPEHGPEHVRILPRLMVRQSSDPLVKPERSKAVLANPANREMFQMYNVELSRLLFESEGRADALLANLTQQGRRVYLGQFDGERYRGKLPEDSGGRTDRFGESLLNATEADSDFLVIVPKDTAGQLETALAVTIPRRHLLSPELLSMASRAVELTAYSIDRATVQARLERKVAERTQELQAAQAELVRSAQMAVMIPIVTGIAHHLNTPLGNSVLSVSSLLDSARAGIPSTELVPVLELVGRNLDRVVRMVQDFQRIAELQLDPNVGRFEPGPLVADAVSQFRHRFPGISIQLSLPEEPVQLEGSSLAFSAALGALLENAVVHGHFPGVPAQIRVTMRGEARELVLTVGDQGPGLGPIQADQAFEPFFTTRLADSSGLGLTLVHRVMRLQFRGMVRLGSAPEGGLTVETRLPFPPPRDLQGPGKESFGPNTDR